MSWKSWQSSRSHIYIYLGLGSYRLTIIERNDGVVCKVSGRVVKKSSSCVSYMNSECFSDCKSYLLECVDRWCWSRVAMSVEASCLCVFPIMVGKFEGAFWAWEVCDFVVHCSGVITNAYSIRGCCCCIARLVVVLWSANRSQ